jgi:hypothetical protein
MNLHGVVFCCQAAASLRSRKDHEIWPQALRAKTSRRWRGDASDRAVHSLLIMASAETK